jgi:hypothetical protein
MKKKDIFLAVLSIEPYLVSEYIDFESACRVDCLFIIKKVFVRIHTTKYGNDSQIFNFSFLGKNQVDYPIEKDGWRIEEISNGYFGPNKKQNVSNWDVYNDYLISDPNGELRKIKFSNPKDAIIDLVAFSKFPSWSDLELKTQIDDILNE